MNIWIAYRSFNINSWIDDIYHTIAASVARQNKAGIGIIASAADREHLKQLHIEYDQFIEANLIGNNGAQIKLFAIKNFLPEGDAICDMDVFWTKGRPQGLNVNNAVALNYEPLRFYADYSRHRTQFLKCLPSGEKTVNAGFMYMPSAAFKKYAGQALELAENMDCAGHTYEQAFFVKFCQDHGIDVSCIFDGIIHQQGDVEKLYQARGVRHPFCYKKSLIELQKCVQVGMRHAEPGFTERIIKTKYPIFRSMLDNALFQK
jgi:hypothetical protein